MTKFILFDLDGTLLPLDQDEFTKAYFKALTGFLAPMGYDPARLVDGIWKGTAAMVKNDGGATNEEVFWRTFAGVFGNKVLEDKDKFTAFYETKFNDLKGICSPSADAAKLVAEVKERGFFPVIASNPIFPEIGQVNRIKWAGLDPRDFCYITTYENSRFSKPNPAYYREILEKLGANPEDCLMVGNDVNEDMVAETVGIRGFLLTPCMLNKSNKDISRYNRGGFAELADFLDKI